MMTCKSLCTVIVVIVIPLDPFAAIQTRRAWACTATLLPQPCRNRTTGWCLVSEGLSAGLATLRHDLRFPLPAATIAVLACLLVCLLACLLASYGCLVAVATLLAGLLARLDGHLDDRLFTAASEGGALQADINVHQWSRGTLTVRASFDRVTPIARIRLAG